MTSPSPCTDGVGGGGAATPIVAHRDVFLANALCNLAQDIEDSPLHSPHWVKALRGYAHDLLNVDLGEAA